MRLETARWVKIEARKISAENVIDRAVEHDVPRHQTADLRSKTQAGALIA